MAREAEAKLTEDLYKLIGCSRNASPEQILTEYRRKALLLHPDKGGQQSPGHEDEGCQLFQELQFAKDILSNPRKRRHYDLWLTIGTSEFTLTEWMDNQEKIQQTFHWGHQQEQAKLLPSSIDSDQTHEKNKASRSCWKSHNSSMTKAFRNYKI